MPPVFGPVSPSPTRLWSCALAKGVARVPSHEREERNFLAREIVFDDDFRARGAEGAGEHRFDRALRLVKRHRDDDALSRRQAIRLDDDRRAVRANVGERCALSRKRR